MSSKKAFRIDYYKTDDLTPDELNAKRKNAKGIWITAGILTDIPRRDLAIKAARVLQSDGRLLGSNCKIRAIEV